MVTVTIRSATSADADAISRVYVETWRTTYAGLLPDRTLVGLSRRRQAALWSHVLTSAREREMVIVATKGRARVVGFGSGGPSRDPGLGFAAEIYTLYVHPDHQSEGIGRALLGTLFSNLHARGLGSALVWVVALNPARFFYEAMGGRRVAEREEVLWGARITEAAYGWADLEAAVALWPPV